MVCAAGDSNISSSGARRDMHMLALLSTLPSRPVTKHSHIAVIACSRTQVGIVTSYCVWQGLNAEGSSNLATSATASLPRSFPSPVSVSFHFHHPLPTCQCAADDACRSRTWQRWTSVSETREQDHGGWALTSTIIREISCTLRGSWMLLSATPGNARAVMICAHFGQHYSIMMALHTCRSLPEGRVML